MQSNEHTEELSPPPSVVPDNGSDDWVTAISTDEVPPAKSAQINNLEKQQSSLFDLPNQQRTISDLSVKSSPDPCKHWKLKLCRKGNVQSSPPELEKIIQYFQESISEESKLQVYFYLMAYREVAKFLCCLGTLLSFASRDIESKVDRMEELLLSENREKYSYLDELLIYEVEAGIVTMEGGEISKKLKKRNGTRIMFRLHQALAFLVQFFTKVKDKPTSKMHSITSEAYKATISKNHGWLMQKTASLAFHAIPSRSTLISRMGSDKEEKVMAQMEEIIAIATAVYIRSAKIFDTHSKIAAKEPKHPLQLKGD